MKSILRVFGRCLPAAFCVLFPLLASAADIVWTNTAGGNWSLTNNWSPNQVPGAADIAVITNDGTYAISLNVSAAIAGLQLGGAAGTQTLSSASTTLNLSGAGTVAARGAFVLSGGVLDGVGTLTVNGRFDWQSGTMQGAGVTTFGPLSVSTLSTAGQKNLRDRTVNIGWITMWSGGLWYGGYGAVVNIQGGAVLEVQSEAGAPLWSGLMTLNNSGLIRKTAGTGLSSFNWTVNNSASIRLAAGTIGLYGGGVHSGTFQTDAAGATIHFGGGRHDFILESDFTGPGLFSIGDSGDARFQSPHSSGARWRLSGGGALNGTNTVTFDGPFDWQAGTMGDAGQTVFSPSALATLSTGGQKNLRDRTLTIQGTATWSGGLWYGGYGAVVNVQPGATLDVQSELGAPVWFGAITLNNAGTLRKSAGTGLSSFNWPVHNSGTIDVQTGTVGLYGGGTQTGLFQTAGAATRFHFGGGTHDLLPGVSFTGAGLFTIGDGGYVRALTPLVTAMRWQLLNGGVLGGTNAVTFTGIFDWQAGQMQDAGQTIFSPTAAVTFSTGGQKNLRDRTMTFQGNATWSGGLWYGGYGAVVNVQPGAVFDVTSEAGAPVWFGAITLNNTGTLRKSAGTGLSSFNWPVHNSGTIDVQTGTVGLYGGGTQTGLFQTAGAATRFHFGGGTHDLLPGVSFTGAGLFTIGDSGYVRVQTPLTTALRWQLLNGGVLGGTNAVTFAGIFDWQAGQMQDAGQTIFSPTAAVTFSTGGQKNLRDRTLTIQGTATWSGGLWYGGYGAVVNVQPGAVFDVTSEAGAPVWFGAITLNNTGTLRKSAGMGLSSFNWPVHNSGTIDVQTGTVGLYGGGTQTGSFQTAGAANRFHFGGGTHDLLPGVSFAGAGLFTIGDSGYVRVQTPLTTALRWQLLNGGVLGGTNAVTFTGTFDWQAGQMQDAGQTIFTPSSTVALSTTGQKNLRERRVNIGGTATWTGGQWYGGYGAVVNILGGGILDAQSEVGAPVWASTIVLNNHGTLRKSAGAGLSYFNWTFTNYAAVRAQSGRLGFYGTCVQSSGTTTLEGGHLAGTLLDIRGGELRGAGSIAGDVRNWADVHPGGPFNFLIVSNNVSQIYSNTAAGRLNLELGGLIPGTNHDQVRVSGPANLSGTLNVDFVNGFLPVVGNSFTVMTYTARSGSFAAISSPPGITLQAAYFPTHLVLSAVTVTQVPPFIITQPTNLVLQAGLTAIFRVVASGTPQLNYQWQSNGVDILGATTDTLRIPGVTVTNAASYRAIVSNLGGQTNSVNALLIVQPGFQAVEINTGNTNALVGAAFINGRDGAIIGSNGVMQVTGDGGATWTTVNTGMTNITDVQFVGGAIFISGGGAHTICVSYDGGATWGVAYPGPQRVNRMRFLNSTNGFAVGDDGAILQWNGTTWAAMDTPIDVRLLGIHYCGGLPVVAGEAGQIWRFDGTNWMQTFTEVNLTTFNDLRFCGSGGTGFAVGTGGVIYRTTDCGLSWNLFENPLFGGNLNSIAFGDCSTIWIAGDNGTILQSTDGGVSWGTIYTGATNRIREIVFIDGYGYYVDDSGHIHQFFYAGIPANPPPRVALTLPASAITNWACVHLLLRAEASDTNGFVTRVEFFADTTGIETDELPPRWSGAWTNDRLGEFTLTAVATDNQGATAVSAPVKVTFILPPLHRLIPVGFVGPRTNYAFKVCMTGEAGRDYEIYAHTNVAAPFATWDLLGLMTPDTQLFDYLDFGVTNKPYRFYRARQVPP